MMTKIMSASKASKVAAILYVYSHSAEMPAVGSLLTYACGGRSNYHQREDAVTAEDIQAAKAVLAGKLDLTPNAADVRTAFVAPADPQEPVKG